MTSLLKRLSEIDDKSKNGVYGWIRKAEEELQLGYIPLMISSICILYYYEDEIFEIASKDVKLSKDGKSIIKIAAHCDFCNMNFGKVEIISNTDNIAKI